MKTHAAILGEMLQMVPNYYDKRDTSPIVTALSPAAWALEGFYLTLEQVRQSAFVQTAVGEDLDLLSILGGITRYPASKAVRLGLFDAPVPLGTRFSTANGTEAINFVVTGQRQDGYELTAETAGTVGNQYTGVLLPIDVVSGLRSAQVTDILIPGDDTETDEQLRERLILALNQKPFGGNIADYRANISAIDGVGGVQVYPTWQGGGTVKCSIVGADFLPASPELIETVQTAIDPTVNQGQGLGLAPIGAQVTIATPQTVEVSICATVTLATGYTIGQIQPLATKKMEGFLSDLRQSWAKPVSQSAVGYALSLYRAQVIAALMTTTGVVNVPSVTINGAQEDLHLEQSGSVQQLPVLREVQLVESS